MGFDGCNGRFFSGFLDLTLIFDRQDASIYKVPRNCDMLRAAQPKAKFQRDFPIFPGAEVHQSAVFFRWIVSVRYVPKNNDLKKKIDIFYCCVCSRTITARQQASTKQEPGFRFIKPVERERTRVYTATLSLSILVNWLHRLLNSQEAEIQDWKTMFPVALPITSRNTKTLVYYCSYHST